MSRSLLTSGRALTRMDAWVCGSSRSSRRSRVPRALPSARRRGGAPHAKPRCRPSYKLKCLDPNASDYDRIGGSGNGPKYTGLVKVVGPDVFRLDADHDGWGCERN